MENNSLNTEIQPNSELPFEWFLPSFRQTHSNGEITESHESSTQGGMKPVRETQHDILHELGILTDMDVFASASSVEPQPSSEAGMPDRPDQLGDDELVNLPLRKLNKRLSDLPACEVQKMRKRRRCLKNRGYALSCRSKRQLQQKSLEEKNIQMTKELRYAKAELQKVRKERDTCRTKYEQLQHVWSTCGPPDLPSGWQSSM